jgi:enoyl-CoA hydratase/carnithine racemase
MPRHGNPESLRLAPEQVLFFRDAVAGIARIVFNRPEKHNALSVPMRARLIELLHQCERDDEVRVIIISGRGKSFCSGNEINEDWGQRGTDYKRFPLSTAVRYGTDMTYGRHGFAQALSRSTKITMVQMHGYCAAAAYFMIATKCDLVVATPDARIGALEARFLGPAGAVSHIHLNRILGTKAARRLGYTAEPISGAEAHRLGLVYRCVAEPDLDAETWRLAERLARRPREQLLYLKARIVAGEGLLDTHSPAMPGLLFSHFLQTEKDELEFWKSVKSGGVSGALKADKQRTQRDVADGAGEGK